MELKRAYDLRLMNEAALPLADRLLALHPKNRRQAEVQAGVQSELAEYDRKLGSAPPTTWRNLSELDQIVTAHSPPAARKAPPSCSSGPIRRNALRGMSSTGSRPCGYISASRPWLAHYGGRRHRFPSQPSATPGSARPTWLKATSRRRGDTSSNRFKPSPICSNSALLPGRP